MKYLINESVFGMLIIHKKVFPSTRNTHTLCIKFKEFINKNILRNFITLSLDTLKKLKNPQHKKLEQKNKKNKTYKVINSEKFLIVIFKSYNLEKKSIQLRCVVEDNLINHIISNTDSFYFNLLRYRNMEEKHPTVSYRE